MNHRPRPKVRAHLKSLSADTTILIADLSQTGTISTYGELNELPMPVKTEAQSGVRTPSASRFWSLTPQDRREWSLMPKLSRN